MVLTLAVIVRSSWFDVTGDVAVVARADRRALIALIVVFLVSAALIIALSVT